LDKNAADYGINLQNFIVELPGTTKMNCIVLREAIRLGQTVHQFRIELFEKTKKVREITGTTIGRKRILTFPVTNVTSLKVYLEDAVGADNISGVAAYLIDKKLVEK
jgi:alpha-L-fucosidase